MATAPDGTQLELIEHDGDFLISIDHVPLMSSRMHHSEEELAQLACKQLGAQPRVLVGGLGFGYTLRAVLDLLPEDGRVLQVELVPEVVSWSRGPLASLAADPLSDPRVELITGDVADVIRRDPGGLAAMVLDVDNGPSPLVTGNNAWLYSNAGLQTMWRALQPGASLAVWSRDEDRGFLQRLQASGFEASARKVQARKGRRGGRHVIFLGRRPGS